jgi:hypothetical protein
MGLLLIRRSLQCIMLINACERERGIKLNYLPQGTGENLKREGSSSVY